MRTTTKIDSLSDYFNCVKVVANYIDSVKAKPKVVPKVPSVVAKSLPKPPRVEVKPQVKGVRKLRIVRNRFGVKNVKL